VTETTAPIAGDPRTSTAARIGWAVLILATLYVCYFSHLGAIGFVGPDEPRYAWIARDMAETGDWVTPRLYGKPWFEKPPLFYWGAALSFKLFGVSEAAARLPSAISALLATLALAWLALRLYGEETGRWLLLLLPTTVGMIGFSHAAATDMPFSAMLTIAMVCAAVLLGLTRNENSAVIPQTSWLALILFGFFLGLAVLAKGPAAIILSGGAVFFWALFTKRWRAAFRLFHPAALASFCLTALPWYILCARRNPDFFRIFIIAHNFKRFLTPEFQHIQPFWYYAPVILLALVPWVAILLKIADDGKRLWQENRWKSSPSLFFVCWAVFTVVFFSLSKSKLPGYVLPAIPPLALLVARGVYLRVERALPGGQWIAVTTGITLIFLALAARGYAAESVKPVDLNIDYTLGGPAITASWIFLIGGIVSVIFGSTGRAVSSLRVVLLSILVGMFVLLKPLPGREHNYGVGEIFSARVYAVPPRGVSAQFWAEHLSAYKLNRSYQYGLNFYLRREIPEWDGDISHERWILTNYLTAKDANRVGLQCYTPLFFKEPIVRCKVPGSADGPPRSGQSQQEK
jgi:4-amino-4-deoxy-L-arabinose transferase-like glycosyltransferase